MREVSPDRTKGLIMKRQVTLWQAMILLLILLLTAGIYFILGWVYQRVRERGYFGSLGQPSQTNPVLQIVEPLDGAVLQRADAVAVQAAMLEPDFAQGQLFVDG